MSFIVSTTTFTLDFKTSKINLPLTRTDQSTPRSVLPTLYSRMDDQIQPRVHVCTGANHSSRIKTLVLLLIFLVHDGIAQNPPSIPTLPVVQLAAFLRGSRVIIDWHNTGYSMLSLRLGEKHPIVRIAKLYAQ